MDVRTKHMKSGFECDVQNGVNRMLTSEHWSIFIC